MFARGLAFGLVSTLLVHGQIKASVSSNTEPGRKQALDAVKCLVKDRGARGLASAGNGGYYDDADDIGAYDFDDQGYGDYDIGGGYAGGYDDFYYYYYYLYQYAYDDEGYSDLSEGIGAHPGETPGGQPSGHDKDLDDDGYHEYGTPHGYAYATYMFDDEFETPDERHHFSDGAADDGDGGHYYSWYYYDDLNDPQGGGALGDEYYYYLYYYDEASYGYYDDEPAKPGASARFKDDDESEGFSLSLDDGDFEDDKDDSGSPMLKGETENDDVLSGFLNVYGLGLMAMLAAMLIAGTALLVRCLFGKIGTEQASLDMRLARETFVKVRGVDEDDPEGFLEMTGIGIAEEGEADEGGAWQYRDRPAKYMDAKNHGDDLGKESEML